VNFECASDRNFWYPLSRGLYILVSKLRIQVQPHAKLLNEPSSESFILFYSQKDAADRPASLNLIWSEWMLGVLNEVSECSPVMTESSVDVYTIVNLLCLLTMFINYVYTESIIAVTANPRIWCSYCQTYYLYFF
jgi:hypothetical protein